MNDDQLTKFLMKSGLLGEKTPAPKPQPAQKTATEKQNFKSQKPNPTHKNQQTAQPEKPKAREQIFHGKPAENPNRGKPFGKKPHGKPSFFKRSTNATPGKLPEKTPQNSGKKSGEIRIVPLGGLEQVGQNMMFLEWGDDIIVIDCGVEFPSPEHLGVDAIVPDISYLEQNRHKIRGVIFTHGHLDHIGAAQFLIPTLKFPSMFATKLTKELILANADNPETPKKYRITEVNLKTKLRLGKFEVEFFPVNHSIPDSVGVVVKTPYGSIVHTSDFKIDPNPSDDKPADLARIAKIGAQGVALAMVDSTNALLPGHTVSESVIEAELEKFIKSTQGRIVIATFASNIGRIAKIVEAAEKNGRTVFLSGRSMERNVAIARKLRYLKCKENTLKRISPAAEKMDPGKVLILSTGTQGEELAALTRMAAGTHRMIKLSPSDTVLFSSSTIPGNELSIVSVLNNLSERGVKKVDNSQLDSHVSGHGHAEEVKLMTSLLNPKFFAPIHGELFMRHGHQDLIVKSLGIPRENTFVMKNGQGLILDQRGARLMTDREKIPSAAILIESGEKIAQFVLDDRMLMADGGAIFVSLRLEKGVLKKVDIRSHGFRFSRQKHQIFEQLEKETRTVFQRNFDPARPEKALEEVITKSLQKFLWQTFKKDSLVEVIISH